MSDDFRDRYKRKVLNFIGAPDDVDLETVTISFRWDEGYSYSEYTFENPNLEGSVTYERPRDETDNWGQTYKAGSQVYVQLWRDDTIRLMNSFGD